MVFSLAYLKRNIQSSRFPDSCFEDKDSCLQIPSGYTRRHHLDVGYDFGCDFPMEEAQRSMYALAGNYFCEVDLVNKTEHPFIILDLCLRYIPQSVCYLGS